MRAALSSSARLMLPTQSAIGGSSGKHAQMCSLEVPKTTVFPLFRSHY